MLNVVPEAISVSICKLPCKMYGTLKCGATSEMSGDASNREELPGKIEGNVGACWFGEPKVAE